MYVCAPCACLVPAEGGRGVESFGTQVTGGCELPCRCDPLQQQ